MIGEDTRRSRAVAARLAVLLAALWLGYLGGLCLLTVAPRAIGWQPHVVLTGSMSPALPTGSVVLAASVDGGRDALPLGSIVVVRDDARPGGAYIHRVVGRQDDGLVTRGDANLAPDRRHVEPNAVLGKVRAVLPGVGLPVLWWHDRRWVPLAGFLAVSWLAVVLVLRRRDLAPAAAAPAAAVVHGHR